MFFWYHYFCIFLDFCFFWPKKKSIEGFLNPVHFIKDTPWVYLSKSSQIARKHLLISLSARNFAIYTLIFRNVRILFCNYMMVRKNPGAVGVAHQLRVEALQEALQSACPAARRRRACGLAARAMCMPLLLRSDASSTCHRAEDLPDPCSSKSNSGCATVADWGTAGCVSCSSASASMLPGRTRHVQVVAAGELTFPPSPRAVRT